MPSRVTQAAGLFCVSISLKNTLDCPDGETFVIVVPVDKKEFKSPDPWVMISNFHVKIDGCVGQSFIRSYASLAREVVGRWLASPKHRESLLSKTYQRLGAGPDHLEVPLERLARVEAGLGIVGIQRLHRDSMYPRRGLGRGLWRLAIIHCARRFGG